MKCPRCQKEVNDDNQFCPYCGQKLPHKEDPLTKEYNEMRKQLFIRIMNRIMNIATIVAVIFTVIGVFGPVIELTYNYATYDIGGLYWFSYEGWLYLQDGKLSIGPFITTFVLYIITVAGVVTLSSLAMTRAINSLRKKEECKTVPHLILLAIIYRVYSAFVSCFYYASISGAYDQTSTGSAWGESLYTFALPIFTIAFIAYIIVKAIFTRDSKIIVTRIFTIISSFVLLNMIGNAFTTLAYIDVDFTSQTTLGILRYFEEYQISTVPAVIIFSLFGLGIVFLATIITLGIINIRNLAKNDSINRKAFLTLSICAASIGLIMFILTIVFGAYVNQIPGLENCIFGLSESIVLILLSTQIVLGLAIAVSCIKEKKEDPNIIDVEVIEN